MLLALPVAAVPDSNALRPLGSYSSISQDAEHCNGYQVTLWKYSDLSLRGIFRACAGLVGEPRSARINAGRFDPQANAVTFEADLSLGMDYVAGGSEIPSRDHFAFDGKLQDGNLQGVIVHSDFVHPGRKPKSTTLVLSHRDVPLEYYGTLEEWEKAYGM